MKNIVLFFMVLGLGSAALDLKRSIERIQVQIQVTKDKPANWTHLPLIIQKAIPCLSGIGIFEVEGRMPVNLKQYIESITPASFAQELLQVNWAEISAKRDSIEPFSLCEYTELKEFAKTEKFDVIHHGIWRNVEFLDLVGYLYEANYGGIYAVIKGLYESNCLNRTDLIPSLPTQPPTYNNQPVQTQRKLSSSNHDTLNNFPIITKKSTVFKEEEKCDIAHLLELLQILNQSDIHQVIKVFLYILQEFIGNAAMHVLVMKVGEPQKGEFFNAALSLPEMEDFLEIVQGAVLRDPGIGQLNEILRQLTGLTIANKDLFIYIINLIKYLVWNHPFP